MSTLVIPVRGGENEELRYALRAACKNLPHDQLWVIGEDSPAWLQPTGVVLPPATRSKWRAIRAAFEAIAHVGNEIADSIVWMDDDMFVMTPWSGTPYHLGAELTNAANATHTTGLHQTWDLLRRFSVSEPYLNYEVHAPMPMSRTQLRLAMSAARPFTPQCFHPRTFYGNLFKVGGQYCSDFKVRRDDVNLSLPILSTTDHGFKTQLVGEFVRAAFPDPCQWEAA